MGPRLTGLTGEAPRNVRVALRLSGSCSQFLSALSAFTFCFVSYESQHDKRQTETVAEGLNTHKHGTHMHACLFHATFDWWC